MPLPAPSVFADCSDLVRRIGCVEISMDAFCSQDTAGREIAGLIFTRLVVVHTDFYWDERRMVMRCLSPEFDVRDPAGPVPRYTIEVKRDQDRDRYFHTVKFVRV